MNRPCSAPDGVGSTMDQYDIPFPGGYTQFFLGDYVMAANAAPGSTADISPGLFTQTTWATGYVTGGYGDISFGSPANIGPTDGYAAEMITVSCQACSTVWPKNGVVLSVGASNTSFRLAIRSRTRGPPGSLGWVVMIARTRVNSVKLTGEASRVTRSS